MLTGMQHEENIEKIVLSSSLSNVSINRQNCFRNGNLIHIYVKFSFTGNVTGATSADFASGLPIPKSVSNADNGFGLALGNSSGNLGYANGYVTATGGLRQSWNSSFSSGDDLMININYYI